MTVETFNGKKLEAVYKEIQEKYGGNYKVVEQTKKRKFLWMADYEVKIMLSEKEEFKQKIKEPMVQNKDLILALLESAEEAKKKEETIVEEIKEIGSIKEMVDKTLEKQEINSKNEEILHQMYVKLTNEEEVKEIIAEQIIQEVKRNLPQPEWMNKKHVEAAVQKAIQKRIRVTGPFDVAEVKTIALVGPTGVGKTTTLAKIAAILKQNDKKIGLVSTDVYRIAAIEQLQTYANIMDSKMIEAKNPQELKEAIDYFKHVEKVDIVLIDTVGRSPMKVDSIEGIKEYLEISKPDHAALVLSSTQKYKDMVQIIKNFNEIKLDSLLFTKLDETMSYGFMLNILEECDIDISYVTNGQNVPKDIVAASSDYLAKQILNGDEENGSSSITA